MEMLVLNGSWCGVGGRSDLMTNRFGRHNKQEEEEKVFPQVSSLSVFGTKSRAGTIISELHLKPCLLSVKSPEMNINPISGLWKLV